jgi:hypothetical protein
MGGGTVRARILSGIAVGVAITILSSASALAGRKWCATDPILEFENGARVQWVSQFSEDYLPVISGPVSYWIEVPENIGRIKVSFPASPVAEIVTISYSGEEIRKGSPFAVRAQILVSGSKRFPTAVSVRGNVRSPVDIAGQSNARTRVTSVVDVTAWHALLDVAPIASTLVVDRGATVASAVGE